MPSPSTGCGPCSRSTPDLRHRAPLGVALTALPAPPPTFRLTNLSWLPRLPSGTALGSTSGRPDEQSARPAWCSVTPAVGPTPSEFVSGGRCGPEVPQLSPCRETSTNWPSSRPGTCGCREHRLMAARELSSSAPVLHRSGVARRMVITDRRDHAAPAAPVQWTRAPPRRLLRRPMRSDRPDTRSCKYRTAGSIAVARAFTAPGSEPPSRPPPSSNFRSRGRTLDRGSPHSDRRRRRSRPGPVESSTRRDLAAVGDRTTHRDFESPSAARTLADIACSSSVRHHRRSPRTQALRRRPAHTRGHSPRRSRRTEHRRGRSPPAASPDDSPTAGRESVGEIDGLQTSRCTKLGLPAPNPPGAASIGPDGACHRPGRPWLPGVAAS